MDEENIKRLNKTGGGAMDPFKWRDYFHDILRHKEPAGPTFHVDTEAHKVSFH